MESSNWRARLLGRLSCIVILAAAGLCRAQDVALSDILVEGRGWKPYFSGAKNVGGLAASRLGVVYVSDPDQQQILVIDAADKPAVLLKTKSAPRGITVAHDASVLFCNPGEKLITSWEGTEPHRETTGIAADQIVTTRESGIYLTVSNEGAVYYMVSKKKPVKVAEGLESPAGLTFWPDEGTLVVSELHSRHLWTYRVDKDGTLSAKDKYYTLRKPSGNVELTVGTMTVDSLGRLYCATSIGVQIFDPTGRMIGLLTKPKDAPVTHVALGGEKGNTLYIACGDEIFARQIQGKGVPWKEKVK